MVAAGLTTTETPEISEEAVATLIETGKQLVAAEDLVEDVSIAATLEVPRGRQPDLDQATDETTIVGTRTARGVGPKKTVSGSQTSMKWMTC